MGLYDNLAATSRKLLAKFGQPALLVTVGAVGYNAATGVLTKADEAASSLNAVSLPIGAGRESESRWPGTLIEAGHTNLMLSPVAETVETVFSSGHIIRLIGADDEGPTSVIGTSGYGEPYAPGVVGKYIRFDEGDRAGELHGIVAEGAVLGGGDVERYYIDVPMAVEYYGAGEGPTFDVLDVAPSTARPGVGDTVTIGADSYRILAVNVYEPGGVSVLFDCLATK